MRFRLLTGDEGRRIPGIGWVPLYELDDNGNKVDLPGEFDVPEWMSVDGFVHQDIYEPVDDEALAAVNSAIAKLAALNEADAGDAPEEVPVPKAGAGLNPAIPPSDPPADPNLPPSTEQENN